jgi:hypothetical protein
MIFLILMGLLILVVTFFHYLQGFFSATLSAIFCVIAAVLAFSYHETVVESLLGGKIADEANAIVLLAMFGIIYLVLRTAFDSLVPGNVRVPSGVDKGGAVVMGLIAGIFAAGIVAIAFQEMPFGPSIAGFARFEVLDDRPVMAPTSTKTLDRTEYSELNSHQPGQFGDEPRGHGVAILPVDNIVVGAVEKFSNGALSTGKPLTNIHPDFLDEMFGQRLGIEAGGNHVAMNLPDKKLDAADLVGLYTRVIPANDKAQRDAEASQLRTGGALKPITLLPSETFLVVRVTLNMQAADQKDRTVRLSPAAVRLVVNIAPKGSSDPEFTNLYPVGTLQDATTLFLAKMDDFLFVPIGGEGDHGIDLVFKVSKKLFDSKPPEGTFLEIKRLARIDLTGVEIKPGPKPDPNYDPMRKTYILAPPVVEAAAPPADAPAVPAAPEPSPAPPAAPSTPAPEPPAKAFQVANATAADTLPMPITAPAGPEGSLVQVPGGTAVLSGGKLKVANLDTTAAEQTLPTQVTQFAVPDGQSMIQVSGTPSAAAPWGFASEPETYEVVDSAGKKYQPYGLYALYDAKGAERVYLRYIDVSTISGSAAPDGAGAPKRIILFFLVPPATSLTEFDDHGQKVHDLSVTAK